MKSHVFPVTFTVSELRQVISALAVSGADAELLNRLLRVLSQRLGMEAKH